MKAFSLGLGLTLVSSFLFLALMAELYYLFWWKKKRPNGEELLHLFFWKKPSSQSSTALNPRQIHHSSLRNGEDDTPGLQHSPVLKHFAGEDSVEAEIMRLHSLSGPPRFLFTITEETKEDMESEDGRSRGGRSRRGSRGKSLADLLHCAETPLNLSPLPSPPLLSHQPMAPMDFNRQLGFNPLFESTSSPPPKFKFLKDAEEKLYRTLREEARRAHINGGLAEEAAKPTMGPEEDGGSFVALVIAKNRERGQQQPHHHHLSSSQVIPLPSSPSSTRNGQEKRIPLHSCKECEIGNFSTVVEDFF